MQTKLHSHARKHTAWGGAAAARGAFGRGRNQFHIHRSKAIVNAARLPAYFRVSGVIVGRGRRAEYVARTAAVLLLATRSP
jgi:hypothetical protein